MPTDVRLTPAHRALIRLLAELAVEEWLSAAADHLDLVPVPAPSEKEEP